MRLTVDANIFFAALIKDGKTRQLLFHPQLQLVAPTFLLVELKKYQPTLQKKFNGTPGEFQSITEKTIRLIRFISDFELQLYMAPVSTLVNDEKDWLYLACALKENTALWTNDQKLKDQSRITIVTTSELLEKIGWVESQRKKTKIKIE